MRRYTVYPTLPGHRTEAIADLPVYVGQQAHS